MRFVFSEWYNRSVKSGCVAEDFTPEVCFNAGILIDKINALGYEPAMLFSGCLRSKAVQKAVYAKKGITDESKIPMKSCHLSGEGVDISDPDGKLMAWLKKNKKKLEDLGLYVEADTKGWCHIQTRKTKNRFFKP